MGDEEPRFRTRASRHGREPQHQRPKLQQKDDTPLTYDEYVRQLRQSSQLFELDEDTKWTKFVDFTSDYAKWLSYVLKKQGVRLYGYSKKHATHLYQLQPVHRRSVVNAYNQLGARFGRQNVRNGGISAGIVVLLLGGYAVFGGSNGNQTDENGQVRAVVDEAGNMVEVTPPDFDVVEPDDLSDDQRVLFNPELGVASYYDDIEGSEVIISQQPLTDQMKTDREGQLEQIAAQMISTSTFQSKFGTVYVTQPTGAEGTDPAQVAFFMTEELLVFMRNRDEPLRIDQLAVYINNIK